MTATVLLINRDGSMHPTGLAADASRPIWRVARAMSEPYQVLPGALYAPTITTTEYRRVGQAGPYVVFEEVRFEGVR